jgi:hypothetical protein
MEPDFPAAHSMDSEWFAVDRQGRVAVFFSGENGPVPKGKVQKDSLGDFLPRLRGMAEVEDWDNDAQVAEQGLYTYQYPEELGALAPYERSEVPARPLHVDQLPPGLRALAKDVRLHVDFAREERVQPVEHVECDFWTDDAVGYLATDGKTVRPVPGREDDFKEWAAEYRRDFPDETAGLTFEGPAEE